MKRLFLILLSLCFVANGFAAKKEMNPKKILKKAKRYFKVLPATDIDQKANAALISLGRKLYFETALSPKNDVSCNTCHNLKTFGVDNRPTSSGHMGQKGDRNSPTSLNASLQFAQFWDGRAQDVEEQALGPILNPIEHGFTKEAQPMKALDNAGYRKLFVQAFPKQKKSFNFKNVGRAIGAFERTLMTPSRFDDFLAGNIKALKTQEIRGLNTFMKVGCTTCHSGVLLGGQMYQKLGLVHAYKDKDMGRYKVTKDEDDKQFFKVSQLRNITKTGPYFHNGQVKSLSEAIRLMGWHQLGRKLSSEQIDDIAAFLASTEAKTLKF